MKIEKSFGEWLPQNRGMVADWVNNLIDCMNEEPEPEENLKSVAVKKASRKMGHKKMVTYKNREVLEFKQMVMEDPALRLLAEQMIEQGYAYDPESAGVLNKSKKGWLCDAAVEELALDEYQIDINDEHFGFKSWNDFFTRQFKPGMREVAFPDDPYVIVNACESAAYRIADHVEPDTKFWLKEQPYALDYMLDHHEYTSRFVGGTVYQAFLSATHYHCWHAPVDGTIADVKLIPGTYYAEVNEFPYDDAGPNNSQAYITHVAARAIIMIEADNKDIGMVCFMPVGMSEVSSCDVAVKKGDKVKKGDSLGRFLFGGSTHCLIFEPDVIEEFVDDAKPAPDFNNSKIQKVCSRLATAGKKGNN